MFIYQIPILKQPRMNQKSLDGSCSSWSPSRQGNLRRSMSLTSNTSVKAAGWVDEHPTDCITTPRERSSRKIRVSELNIVGIFFGVEKQYLLLLVYEHILVGGLEHFLFSISYMGCHPWH